MLKFCDRALFSFLTLAILLLETGFRRSANANEPVCYLRLANGTEINVLKMCGRRIPARSDGRSPVRPKPGANASANDDDDSDPDSIPVTPIRPRSISPTSTTSAPTYPIQAIPASQTGSPGSQPSSDRPSSPLPPSSAPVTIPPSIERRGRDD